MPHAFDIVSPGTQTVYAHRNYAPDTAIEAAKITARSAQANWESVSLEKRADVCRRFVAEMLKHSDVIAEELTAQMGRPTAHVKGELAGFAKRAEVMIEYAFEALTPHVLPDKGPLKRETHWLPKGIVMVIAPWNYPFLTTVNWVVPAIMAGNAVILKHAEQTALVAERFEAAFKAAQLPEGVFQYLHLNYDQTAQCIQNDIDFVTFTGSVSGGQAMTRALAHNTRCGLALELGGNDPAYVAADAHVPHAAEQLLDGVVFNAGQSCCAVERIYVHASVYDAFLDNILECTQAIRLGDPTQPDTTLGPLVRISAADNVRAVMEEAIEQGAKPLIPKTQFPLEHLNPAYVAPQLLTEVTPQMRLMSEETFGPIVGIMKVSSDEEAIAHMNNSHLGLTASLWTADESKARRLGAHLQCGTVLMNRCDAVDPKLPWTGVKDSGRGYALSYRGYDMLVQPKSYHFISEVL